MNFHTLFIVIAIFIYYAANFDTSIGRAQEQSIPNNSDAFSAYLKGEYSRAHKIWFELADYGDVDAQYNLGTLYDNGLGVKRDVTIASHWYRLAAASNIVEAQLVLAAIFRGGEIGPPDIKSAIENISAAANRGFPLAQFELGVAYDLGLGVTQNYANAAAWYEKASALGVIEAKYNLGTLYEEGLGVPRDYDTALVYYQEAARNGNKFAENNIGTLYKNGFGVERNYVLATKWYEKAASGGLPVAQYNLGIMYQLGLGVERDLKVAATWYRHAATQGYQPAQNNLAILLANGWGVRRDFKEAIKWFTIVANAAQGHIAKQAEDNIKTLSLRLFGDKDIVPENYKQKKLSKDKEVVLANNRIREIPLPLNILNFNQPVVILQRLLRELGYYKERVDGLRGPATDKALRLICLEEGMKTPTRISNLFLKKLFTILVSRSVS